MSNVSIGSEVSTPSKPGEVGFVVKEIQGNPLKYQVVFPKSGSVELFVDQVSLVSDSSEEMEHLEMDQFHSRLTSIQLQSPDSSSLYSLDSAKIDYVPYQFRPVLKFLRAERPRLLIADSVGVGKTIEAGLILREAQARFQVRSVLIICPKPLVTEAKWVNEMRRFDEDFEALDGKTFRNCIRETNLNGCWPAKYNKVVLPYSLLNESILVGRGSNQPGLIDLHPFPQFDLIIVDEAHKIRNPNTRAHQAVEFLLEQAGAAVFLTATPLQLGNDELYQLLRLLRPDYFYKKDEFERYLEPNRFIVEAMHWARSADPNWQEHALESLSSIRHTAMGRAFEVDPNFKRVLHALQYQTMNREERLVCLRELESLHTLSPFINRTRRRDIGEFTKRKPETIEINFTPNQRRLHDDILDYLAIAYEKTHGAIRVNFLLSNIRRRLASCLLGLRPYLRDLLANRLDALEELEGFYEDDEALNNEQVGSLRPYMEHILGVAEALPQEDPKLDRLKAILHEKQEMENNKVIIFSSFRHTLAYLYTHLVQAGFRAGLIHGGIKDADRLQLRNRFQQSLEKEDTLDIMLFSEVGTEGLDYQFCDCLINYDLPWNPMAIEQRIGRLDRRGQKSPTLPIYNLVVPNTVDYQIYERCLLRIGVFESSIGECEEILGEITNEIKSIIEDFQLSKEEQSEKLHQMADNKVRELQEIRRMENEQYELFGIQAQSDQFEADVEHARNFWLSARMLHNMIRQYLVEHIEPDRRYFIGDGPRKMLRLSGEARHILADDLKEPGDSFAYQRWEAFLEGAEQYFQVTFDTEYASHDDKTNLITPVHPLAKQAAAHFSENRAFCTRLTVQSNELPPGRHYLSLYRWHYIGLHESHELKVICAHSKVQDGFLTVIQDCRPGEADGEPVVAEDFKDLERIHYQKWKEMRDQYRQDTIARVTYRRTSLENSYNARVALVQDKISQNSDAKINTMYEGELRNVGIAHQKKMKELNDSEKNVDIQTTVIAHCVLNVSNPSGE